MERRRKKLLRTVAGFARGSKRHFFVAILASAAGILLGYLMPQIVGFTVDSVIGSKPPSLPPRLLEVVEKLGGRGFLRQNIIFCALAVVACAALSGAFNYVSRVGIARGTEGFARNLRNGLFDHIQRLPFSWHVSNVTGDVIQRCTYDVEQAQRFVSSQLLEVIRTAILVVFAFTIMFMMNAFLAAVALAFVPLILGYTWFFMSRISVEFRKADEAEGELMTHVQENLTGVRVVRAFGRERYETERFNAKNERFTNLWISLGNTLGIYWGVGDVVSGAQLLAVVAVGAYLAAQGKLTLGGFLVFISYTQMIAWPVRQMGRTLSEMSKTAVSLSRIMDILDAPREEDDPGALRPPLDRDIVFDNVTFSYGGKNVLENVSFTVRKGTTFGILGSTGSGKSTITYLLSRLYDLPEGCGTITIGGVDIRKIDRRYLRKNVGIVLQEPFLFSKTVFENIDIARKSGDLRLVRKMASIAAVDDSVMSFRDGYDTLVGERGVTLSGGQKQRIAIARTLMLEPPILVFDDSMSSLDMETDQKVRRALKENTAGATVIIISHRISTLMDADAILVLDNGRVAQIGSHSELISVDGPYRRIYDLQCAFDYPGPAEADGRGDGGRG